MAALFVSTALFQAASAAGEDTLRTAPDYSDRIPRQKVGKPFASLTLGLGYEIYRPSNNWIRAGAAGELTSFDPGDFDQVILHLGGLHFFGHAEFGVDIPVWTLAHMLRIKDEEVDASMAFGGATTLKYFPWALDEGKLRPYVGTGLLYGNLQLKSPAPGSGPEQAFKWFFPLDLGLAYRVKGFAILDVKAQWVHPGDLEARENVAPTPLGEPEQHIPAQTSGLDGVRLSMVAKWNVFTTPQVIREGYRESAAKALAARAENGTMSGFTVAIGPSGRVYGNSSDYFQERRPYLEGPYSEKGFFHYGLGYYYFPADLEIRLAYRQVSGSGRSFGASIETERTGFFVEALKLIDWGYYGFVPFVGMGIGREKLTLVDQGGGTTTREKAWKTVGDVVFGWDIRVEPTTPLLLRTNLRWIPSAKTRLGGTEFDFGGLEYDLIQLVFYPERFFR